VVLGVVIVVLAGYMLLKDDEDTERILAAALHVPLLILSGIMEGIIRLAHRRRQSLGYLEFYRQTKKLLPIPFQTSAYSVAALLVMQSVKNLDVDQKVWILVVLVLEALMITVFDVLYIKRVLRHNRKETLPDSSKYLHSPLTDIPDTRRRRRDVVFDNQIEVIRSGRVGMEEGLVLRPGTSRNRGGTCSRRSSGCGRSTRGRLARPTCRHRSTIRST